MKSGSLVRLRKSHPAVKRWRNQYKRCGSPKIGQWAEEGAILLDLGECDYGAGRRQVLGPGGEPASFDDYLLTTRGIK